MQICAMWDIANQQIILFQAGQASAEPKRQELRA